MPRRKELTEGERGYILGQLDHNTIAQVHQNTGQPESTIRSIKDRCANDLSRLKMAPRSGRHRGYDNRTKQQVVRAVQGNPKATFKIHADSAAHKRLSPWQVSQICACHGLFCCSCRRKCYISLVNKLKRMAWARKAKDMDWDQVIWTDEASFEIGMKRRGLCTRVAGLAYDEKHLAVKYCKGASVMEHGIIAKGFNWPLHVLHLLPAQQLNGAKIRKVSEWRIDVAKAGLNAMA